jgi:hypothetical protein
MLPQLTTETDPVMAKVDRDDEVVQLRELGSHRVHRLPGAPSEPLQGDWLVGSGDDCALRLTDPSGRISRRHARLLRERSHWCLLDVGSKNGMRVDGSRQATALLEPGIEITLGGVNLIAESTRWISLRGFLSRLLGWRPERIATVDAALRALRLAQVRRTPLVLRGDGDWVGVAQDLHTRRFGSGRPFVLCAGRESAMDRNLRSTTTVEVGLDAIAAARGGTLCVRSRHPPADFIKVVAALRSTSLAVQLILCDDSRGATESILGLPITIPGLSSRYDEVPRIIDEYCRDAVAALGIPMNDGRGHVRGWILQHAATTLADIERAAYLLFALRSSKSEEQAAQRLGLEVAALRAWLDQIGARHVARGVALPPWKVSGDA